MRVAYLVRRFPTVTETFIVREMDALEARGHEVELLTLLGGDAAVPHDSVRRWAQRCVRPRPLEALGALVWWTGRRPLRTASSVALVVAGHARRPRTLAKALATVPLAAAVARTLQRGAPVEHVHAHWANFPALAAWLCRRLTDLPYSFTAHAHDLYLDQSFLARKVRDAAFVVAVSEHNQEILAGEGGDTPVAVVRCGVEPERYVRGPREPRADGRVRALCVGALKDYKGHDVLLDALGRHREALGRLDLVLAGDGPRRAALEAQVEQLGLGDRVRFLGAVSEDAVRDLLLEADLFVLASIVRPDGMREGVPVALMEALAAEVPAVTTRASGVAELVRDGETGLLVRPGDPDDLAAALVAVLRDPDAAAARARAGRRLVEDEFDVRRSAERLEALLVASRRRRGGSPRTSG